MKTTTLPLKHSMNRGPFRLVLLLIPLALVCFALSPPARAVCQQGCDSSLFNAFLGDDALISNTSGSGNTALGWRSLFSNTDASFNTAVGGGALALNNADSNTAVGAAALLLNTFGVENTAVGTNALLGDTTFGNTGGHNDAIGAFALFSNSTGSLNQAIGAGALFANSSGSGNTAIGDGALSPADSAFNTAVGFVAGQNITGFGWNDNIYIGDSAGTLDNAGNFNGNESGVIRIGSFFSGAAACFINGIANNGPFADTVTIDPATGQLGGLPSSARFKKDIEPMGETSEAIYLLKPVTFHYKKDKTNTPWFGLIAEDVANVNRALIGLDKEGKPYCVAYDKVNAMLLNEFLKEHRKVEEQGAMIVRQQKQIEALTAGLQKVSAQLELSKSGSQTVLNSQ